MRPSSLLSILFLLGTTAASAVPAARIVESRDAAIANGAELIDRRLVNDATSPGSWNLLARTNDGGHDGGNEDGLSTKVTVVGKGEASGDVVVLGVMSTGDGNFSVVGEGLGADRNGQIVASLTSLGFTGTAGTLVRFAGADGDPAPVIAVVALGKVDGDPTPDKLRTSAGAALRQLAGVNKVVVMLPADSPENLAAVAEGAALGVYAFQDYKTAEPTPLVAEVVVPSSADGAADIGSHAEIVSRHVKGSRRLTSTPANVLFPQSFLDIVNQESEGLEGVEIEVWDEKRLKEEGMNLLLNVGVGSPDHPPRLVKVAYTPSGDAKGHVALVGKGITFDSGGLNLKTGAGMATMKSDMTGAGVVFHTALAAAELKLPVRVTAWLCLAENMPDGLAQRPGDVWTAYNGKTVEITNTDAEGRLVMGDGLAKAAEEKPDLLIDISTLTGAQVTALGNRIAGLMGDMPAVEAVQKASAVTGEGMWYMPFPEEMYADMVSPVADYRNAGAASDGGMMKGGIFLEPFAEGATWAHIDIAGPSFNDGAPYGFTPIQGTGFGVRTLLKVAEQYGQ